MAVSFFADGVKMLPIKKRLLKKWIAQVVYMYEKSVGDVSYIFCSDSKIMQINNSFLRHDYYTDIITFDYSGQDIVSGDLFVSIDTVRSNAEKYGTVFDNELYRVMIHGILHLCGLNDKSSCEQSKMREAENYALEILYRDYIF